MDVLGAGRTLVMGVLNITPDSFSDGGEFVTPATALARARVLVADGADLVDVGGESTRPGAVRVDPADEQRRIVGVIAELAAERHVISVDTVNAETAVAAVNAGAAIVNDISGGTADPGMYPAVAALGVPYVLQHTRGGPATMVDHAEYDDVVTDVIRELEARLARAVAAGIREENIILDPGLGFAKDAHHNWGILAHLDRFAALGFPLLVGASRKRFLAEVVPPDLAADARERDDATAAITAICAMNRVWGVRVHEARASRDAVRVAEAIRAAAAGVA